jgi:hypothetical protein
MCIDFYFPNPDVKTETTYDMGVDTSIDAVGKVLQRIESNTIIDTTSPVIRKAEIINPILTSKELKLEEEIKKQIPDPPFDVSRPVPDPPPPIEIVTPIDEPPYSPPYTGGGGGGGGGGQFDTQSLDRDNLSDGGMGREQLAFQ